MYRYLHLDVFTDRRFEGNQLAVFPEPQGLTTDEMQRIAKEMAFSESTFIFPPERSGDVRMRIFTPCEELAMAGHPTIGCMLSLQGVAMGRPSRIHVSIDSDEDRITRVRVGGVSVLVGRGELSV